ncbi:MAG: acyl-CoA thioester hydrolase [Actinomycetota bacterium]|nr:acyl-CoA thioester hydrolase [Actinomycetota bacterium]
MVAHRVRIALRWSDMDAYGHVNNVEFLRLLEEARVRALHEWAPEARACLVEGALLVADARIEYLAPLTFRPSPVPIDIWVTDVRPASFRFCYEVLDGETPTVETPAVETGAGKPPPQASPDTVCARAETTMVLFDLRAGRPRRMTEEERLGLRARLGTPVTFKR